MEAFEKLSVIITIAIWVIGLILLIAAILVPINIWIIKNLLKKMLAEKTSQDKFVNYINKQIIDLLIQIQNNTYNLEED